MVPEPPAKPTENCRAIVSQKSEELNYDIYVPDTNALIRDPAIVSRLGSRHVVISLTVLEEMDKHKK